MRDALMNELRLLWLAHARVGLKGEMCLFSAEGTRPWPSKEPGLKFWFGPEGTGAAVEFFLKHYNDGAFPYTPLLLNPIVHHKNADGSYAPLGSGIVWSTALALADLAEDKRERIASLGLASAYVGRSASTQAGLKILGFCNTIQAPTKENATTSSQLLFNLADVSGEEYWPFYLLGGASYLSNTGNYLAPTLSALFDEPALAASANDTVLSALIERFTVEPATIADAAHCWERYDRHPTLYRRFGNDVAKLDDNLRFYEYCARDFALFDAVGPMQMQSKSKQEGFEFLVHGLIPRGSIVLLAGTGGTGKSSLAHKLCCLAATDWRDDETPTWLGQPLVKSAAKGICVYFSGEDGPAIINARNEIFDPEKRSQRLMFQRTHFTSAKGDEIGFAEFLGRLRQMPEVPLLVIDPARKYLTGDEDDSAVVSEFFEAIEQFAHERNTAVIVVHHLSKGAKPTTAREVLDELRGSQVFIDRPRVVIGMLREGPRTVVGLAKCNIPPSLGMVTAERVFAHNPQTLDLVQLPGAAGVRDHYAAPTDEDA